MGTNYYAIKVKPCVFDREIHLGKSSGGWLFCFQEHDDIHTFPQFKKWLETHVDTGEYVIMDEYEREVSKEELLELIEHKQNDEKCFSNPDNFTYSRNIDGYRFKYGDFS